MVISLLTLILIVFIYCVYALKTGEKVLRKMVLRKTTTAKPVSNTDCNITVILSHKCKREDNLDLTWIK